jgi:threonine/homoserine/homoserine lactone efflux protein
VSLNCVAIVCSLTASPEPRGVYVAAGIVCGLALWVALRAVGRVNPARRS